MQMLITLLTGLVARTCLVGSASLVGLWIDSQCKGSACRTLPAVVSGWQAFNYAAALVAMVCTALILNLVFRVAVARIGTRPQACFTMQ